jgi:hypothetical protein
VKGRMHDNALDERLGKLFGTTILQRLTIPRFS